jgi:hypothetical protein
LGADRPTGWIILDPLRYPAGVDGEATEDPGNDIGWIDPRARDEDGEVLSPRQLAARDGMLAWPARFPGERVKEFEFELGQYAFGGQYQQSPTPRKGGIFKREYWQPYVPTKDNKWPDFDFIIVLVDSAFARMVQDEMALFPRGGPPYRA